MQRFPFPCSLSLHVIHPRTFKSGAFKVAPRRLLLRGPGAVLSQGMDASNFGTTGAGGYEPDPEDPGLAGGGASRELLEEEEPIMADEEEPPMVGAMQTCKQQTPARLKASLVSLHISQKPEKIALQLELGFSELAPPPPTSWLRSPRRRFLLTR